MRIITQFCFTRLRYLLLFSYSDISCTDVSVSDILTGTQNKYSSVLPDWVTSWQWRFRQNFLPLITSETERMLQHIFLCTLDIIKASALRWQWQPYHSTSHQMLPSATAALPNDASCINVGVGLSNPQMSHSGRRMLDLVNRLHSTG